MKAVPKKFPLPSLRTFNNLLSVIIVLIAVYVLMWPLLPKIGWWVKHEAPVISQPVATTLPEQPKEAIPKDNTLVIPRLDVTQMIIEGSTEKALDKGIWRRPLASSPDKGGNTVLAGHRFAYGAATPFYNLDKMRVGDPIGVYWEGKAYHYRVSAIKVVQPTEVGIEKATEEPMLTLYTCTPLWTSKQRLVIQARLEEVI